MRAGRGHAVGSVRSILWRLNHRGQLQLLVVGVVALVTIVALARAQDLLVELYNLVSSVTYMMSCDRS